MTTTIDPTVRLVARRTTDDGKQAGVRLNGRDLTLTVSVKDEGEWFRALLIEHGPDPDDPDQEAHLLTVRDAAGDVVVSVVVYPNRAFDPTSKPKRG
jgi:hypothetical protein